MTKYAPICAKMGCNQLSCIVLSLPMFGPIWFCASHALRNLQWQIAIEMENKV